jgi:hypothetical protein
MYGRIPKTRSKVEEYLTKRTSLPKGHYIMISDVKNVFVQVFDTRKAALRNIGSRFPAMQLDIEVKQGHLLPSSAEWMLGYPLGKDTLHYSRNRLEG